MTLDEVKNILARHKRELAETYGVESLGVFGSFARGEEDERSDVDLLVEFGKPIGFVAFMRLERRLGEILGKRVDLVTKKALKPHIGAIVLREVQYVR